MNTHLDPHPNRSASVAAILLISAATFLAVLLVFAVYVIGLSNKEVTLAETIKAKQLDNTSEFDNMWKVIQQTAQVPGEKKDALKEIFVGYAQARAGTGDNKPLMNWIKEAVPNADLKIYDNLLNIITAKRDAWTMRQKELIQLNNTHNIMLKTIPGGMILTSILGRQPIEIQIVTSTKTDNAFKTGKDDDVQLFPKK